MFTVTTKIDGYVDKLYVNVTGQEVKKGQPLLTVYSPELVSSQQEYLTAVTIAKNLSHSADASIAEGGKKLIDSARKRLKLWDISKQQIDRLEETGEVEKYLTLYAPSSGYVIEKKVLPGQKIMPGELLLIVADLSVVWAEADIYESDLPYVKVGNAGDVLPFLLARQKLSGEREFPVSVSRSPDPHAQGTAHYKQS